MEQKRKSMFKFLNKPSQSIEPENKTIKKKLQR